MSRTLVALLLLGNLSAATFDPSRLAFEAARFDLRPLPAAGSSQEQWSQLHVVRLRYEDIQLQAEELRYRLFQPMGNAQVMPEAAELRDWDLDSAASSWDGQFFRGELSAASARIQRIPEADTQDLIYQVHMDGLRPIAGNLLVNGRWQPVTSDVARAELRMRVTASKEMGAPVLESARLLPAPDAEQVHLAVQDVERQWRLAAKELHASGDAQGVHTLQLIGSPRLSNLDAHGLMQLQAEQRLELPLRPGGKGAAIGSVTLQMGDALRVEAERADWQLAADAGQQRPIVEQLRLSPAAGQSLQLYYQADSSGLRQLDMHCASAQLTRLPPTDATERYRLILEAVVLADGLLQDADGQLVPMHMEAARVEAEAEHMPDGTLRLVSLLLQAGPDRPVQCTLLHPSWPWRLQGSELRLQLDAQGYRLQGDSSILVQGLQVPQATAPQG